MANNSFRSDRSRDPLAELARLIGQGDPSSGGIAREAYEAPRPRATAARQSDWAPENHRHDPPAPRAETRYGTQTQASPDRYASPDYPEPQDRYQDPGYPESGYHERAYPGSGHSAQALPGQTYPDPAYPNRMYPEQAYPEQAYRDQAFADRGFEEPAGSRFFSGPAGQFNGFREEPGQGFHHDGLPREYDDTAQMPQAREMPVFPFAPDDHGYAGDDQHFADEAGATDGSRETRRTAPRTVLVAVMAVFALVVVGSAGAFGYRAMFGGSVLPSLPPIIKASNGPNKIALDPQTAATAGGTQAVATTGSAENLVSREEQPVAIEAPKAAPRVVATIPVVGSGQNSMPTGIAGMPAPAAASGPNRIASADPPWPGQAAASAAPAVAAPAAAVPAPPAQPSAEPKKIRTVTIRSDQTGAVPDATGSAARPQSRTAAPARPATAASPGTAPMSIVPGQGDAAPAPAPRVRTAVTSTAPSAAPSSGGGSYVQVTSRRSEGEAQAEFRALQGKFPDQLNGREPIIRRADLGEKGVFFRAYVGPFPSTEEAAQWCASLKAAGQNCVLQRN